MLIFILYKRRIKKENKGFLQRFIRPQKKRENPAFRSFHTLRLWHVPIQSRTSNAQKPTPMNLYNNPNTPLYGYNKIQDTYKNIPRASIVALCRDWILKLPDFSVSRTKR